MYITRHKKSDSLALVAVVVVHDLRGLVHLHEVPLHAGLAVGHGGTEAAPGNQCESHLNFDLKKGTISTHLKVVPLVALCPLLL